MKFFGSGSGGTPFSVSGVPAVEKVIGYDGTTPAWVPRTVVDQATRDAIPANIRFVGMVVTLSSNGLEYELVGGVSNANWQLVAGQSPFRGEYFVDPTFTGIQLGSTSNPFTTIAAAFAFALALGVTRGVVYINNVTENVTFPTTGDWEIASCTWTGVINATITGNVDVSTTTTARRSLRCIRVTGNVTGVAPAGNTSRCRFIDCQLVGAVSLTATGGGTWRSTFQGMSMPGQSGIGGSVGGAVTCNGAIYASEYFFNGGAFNITLPEWSMFTTCYFGSATTFFFTGGSAGQQHILTLQNMISTGSNITFNLDGSGPTAVVAPDYVTASLMLGNGAMLAGAGVANIVYAGPDAGLTVVNGTGNIAPTNLTARYPSSMLQVNASVTLLTFGTLGNVTVNVTYTDQNGAVKTRVITPALDVTGVSGDVSSSSLIIDQNGATNLQYSVTGITTPGSLRYRLALSVGARR